MHGHGRSNPYHRSHLWMGGSKTGSPDAARTDDILIIIQMQLEALPPGPKLIAGDLNGSPDVLDAITTLTREYGWRDLGMVAKLCKGEPGQYTCHANENAKESRIDFLFANGWLFPAIPACDTSQCNTYPGHRPLIIGVNIEKLGKVIREL